MAKKKKIPPTQPPPVNSASPPPGPPKKISLAIPPLLPAAAEALRGQPVPDSFQPRVAQVLAREALRGAMAADSRRVKGSRTTKAEAAKRKDQALAEWKRLRKLHPDWKVKQIDEETATALGTAGITARTVRSYRKK